MSRYRQRPRACRACVLRDGGEQTAPPTDDRPAVTRLLPPPSPPQIKAMMAGATEEMKTELAWEMAGTRRQIKAAEGKNDKSHAATLAAVNESIELMRAQGGFMTAELERQARD